MWGQYFWYSEVVPSVQERLPQSLNGAPLLLPESQALTRRALDQWLDEQQIHPLITGEFQDTALMKEFGQKGIGLLPGPSAIEEEVCRQYSVKVVGRIEQVRERYFAISVERRLKSVRAGDLARVEVACLSYEEVRSPRKPSQTS